MKKFGEYDLNRLSDSRILYMRTPPKFMQIFVVLVVAILLGAGIWSALAVKAEEIKTTGMIVAEGKYPVTSEYTGIVSNIYFEEGDSVNAGDIIMDFDTTDIDIGIAKLISDLEKTEARIEYIGLMLAAIRTDSPQNPISLEDDMELYTIFEAFLAEFELIGNDDEGEKESIRLAAEQKLANESRTSEIERDSMAVEIATQEMLLEKLKTDLEKAEDRKGYIEIMLSAIRIDPTQNPISMTEDMELHLLFEGFIAELESIGDDNDEKKESLIHSVEQKLAEERKTNDTEREALVAEMAIQEESMNKLKTDLLSAEIRMAYIASMISAVDEEHPRNPITTEEDRKQYEDLYLYFNSFILEIELVGKDNADKKEALILSAEQTLATESKSSEIERDTLASEMDVQNEIIDKLEADLQRIETKVEYISLMLDALDSTNPKNPIVLEEDKKTYAGLYQYFENFLSDLKLIGKDNEDKAESLRLSTEKTLADERKSGEAEHDTLVAELAIQDERIGKLETDLQKIESKIEYIALMTIAIDSANPQNPITSTEDMDAYASLYRYFESFLLDISLIGKDNDNKKESLILSTEQALAGERKTSETERDNLTSEIAAQDINIDKLEADLQKTQDRMGFIDLLLNELRKNVPQNPITAADDQGLYAYFNNFLFELGLIGLDDADKRESLMITTEQALIGERRSSETDRDRLTAEIAIQNEIMDKYKADLQKADARSEYIALITVAIDSANPQNPIISEDDKKIYADLYQYFESFLLDLNLIGKDNDNKKESLILSTEQALASERKSSVTDRDRLIAEISIQNEIMDKMNTDLGKAVARGEYIALMTAAVDSATPQNPITSEDDKKTFADLYRYFESFLFDFSLIGKDNDNKKESLILSTEQALAGERKTSETERDNLTSEMNTQVIKLNSLNADIQKAEARMEYINLMLDAIDASSTTNPLAQSDDLELYMYFEDYIIRYNNTTELERELVVINAKRSLATEYVTSKAERDNLAVNVSLQQEGINKIQADIQKAEARMGHIDLLINELREDSPQNPITASDDQGLYLYFNNFIFELGLIGVNDDDDRGSVRVAAKQTLAGEGQSNEAERTSLASDIAAQQISIDKLDDDLQKAEGRIDYIDDLLDEVRKDSPQNITTVNDQDLYLYFDNFIFELELIGINDDDERKSVRMAAKQTLAGESQSNEAEHGSLTSDIAAQQISIDKLDADLQKAEDRIRYIDELLDEVRVDTPQNITTADNQDLYLYFNNFIFELGLIGNDNNDKEESLIFSTEQTLAGERRSSETDNDALVAEIAIQSEIMDKLKNDMQKTEGQIDIIDSLLDEVREVNPQNPITAIDDQNLYLYFNNFIFELELIGINDNDEMESIRSAAKQTLAGEGQSSETEKNDLKSEISVQTINTDKLKTDLQKVKNRMEHIDLLLTETRDESPRNPLDATDDRSLYLYFNNFIFELGLIGVEDDDERDSLKATVRQTLASESQSDQTEKESLESEIKVEGINLSKIQTDIQRTDDRLDYIGLMIGELREESPQNPITAANDQGLYSYFDNFILELDAIWANDDDEKESIRVAAKQSLANDQRSIDTERNTLTSEIAAQEISLDKLKTDLQKTQDRIRHIDTLLNETRDESPHNPLTAMDDQSLYLYFNNFIFELGLIESGHDNEAESLKLSTEQTLASESRSIETDIDAARNDINVQDGAIDKLKTDLKKAEDRMMHISLLLSELREESPQNPITLTDDQALHLYFNNFIFDLESVGSDNENNIRSLKLSTEQNLAVNRRSNETERDDLITNIMIQETTKSRCYIRSAISGVIHYDTDIFAGTSLQIGSVIGSISDADEKKIIEMYVPSGERSRIEAGQECRFTPSLTLTPNN